MADKLKICHDRVLPKDLYRPQTTLRRGGSLRAVIEFRKLWIHGSTLRVRFLGGTAAQQAKAKEQALWWTRHANLKFEFGTAPDAEIRVSFDRKTTTAAWALTPGWSRTCCGASISRRCATTRSWARAPTRYGSTEAEAYMPQRRYARPILGRCSRPSCGKCGPHHTAEAIS